MKKLKPLFLVTDIGFILYWMVTLLHLIPDEYLFNDYTDKVLTAWNWSFLPLDLAISATGFLSLYFYKKNISFWRFTSTVSLSLTFCSGLQAISFWIIRGDFDLLWWLPNLFLLIYPIPFIIGIARTSFTDADKSIAQ